MAAITRRLWSELRAEAILAAGGQTYTGFSTRMEYWLTEAYYDLCAMYHHYVFDKTDPATVSRGTSSFNLPTDCYVVIGVSETDSAFQPSRYLTPERPQVLFGHYRRSPAAPKAYTRIGNKIMFDSPPVMDTTYRLDYYRTPIAPDFAKTSGQPNSTPETDWIWDTHLIDGTLSKAKRRIWRPDLAAFDAQPLASWLAEQIQGQTKDMPLISTPDVPIADRALGGKQ